MFTLCRATLLVFASLALLPLSAAAWDRGHPQKFATLPPGSAGPEGLTIDGAGNVYATTFAVPPRVGGGQLFVFDEHGRLSRQVTVADSSSQLLGTDFHPTTGALLVIDFGNARVLKVDPVSGASSVFATVTGSAGLNALTFDKDGNVYISDSFQGIIWRTGPNGGLASAWFTDTSLLGTTGVPPFGANGMGFNNAFTTLFVANTGNDTIVQIPVASGIPIPKAASVFVNSINGADGLIVDKDDNIWVAANQADEIVVVDKTGKAIAKLGDFNGIDGDGAPAGLLFPASLARRGDWIYVTNLSLDLRKFGLPTVDSQWAAEVTSQTISRIRARIPR